MPTYDRRGKTWMCNECNVPYSYKQEAQACETRHQAMRDWSQGKIDDLQLAVALGYPTQTPQEQDIALQRVRDLTTGGRDPTFQPKAPGAPAAPFGGARGTLIGMTQLHGGGRVQVPAAIRRQLGLRDGHNVFWYELRGRYYISPMELSAAYQQVKTTGAT